MDRDEIKEFVKEILGPNTLTVDTEGWVGLCCPLSVVHIRYTLALGEKYAK